MPVCIAKKYLQLPPQFKKKIDHKAYNQFLERLCNQKHIKQAVFTFPFSCGNLLHFLTKLDPQNEFLFYREKPEQSQSTAAGGSLVEIKASGSDRFLAVQQQIQNVKNETLHFNTSGAGTGIRFLGGFSFFNEIESAEWNHFNSASFTLAKLLIFKNKSRSALSVAVRLNDKSSPESIHQQVLDELEKVNISVFDEQATTKNGHSRSITKTSSVSYDEWKTAIAKAKEKIAEKAFDKVVLARELRVSSQNKFNPVHILNRLRNHYPECCSFLIRHKTSDAFIGSSPERLLSFNGNYYQTEALAGSMQRGTNKSEDRNLENKLKNSHKNQQEHKLVIKHIKNILASQVQSIEISCNTSIKKLANVQHLYTPVRFESNASPLEFLSHLHPTPALGGYPQEKAVKYLSKNCLINRGWFGAPVGWMDSEGNGEFTVAIRCGLVGKHAARLFAGCGITVDSDPKAEWEESKLKFMPMFSALRNE